MKVLFNKRRKAFAALCLKYSRYAFNDHFVLVLLFLLGALLFQYNRLLTDFPQNPWVVRLFLGLATLSVIYLGRIGTYSLSADKHFLLAKEEEIVDWLNVSKTRSFLVWSFWQIAIMLFLVPLFLASGLSWFGFWLLLSMSLILKYYVFHAKFKVFFTDGHLDFERLIYLEKKRQQRILQFFALFTTVKGISTSVKRRAYLDGIIRRLPQKGDGVWFYLFARAFFRSGDYLGLTLRLLALSLASLFFIDSFILASSLAVLFNFLLLFQLLALYKHYDYQYLTKLYAVPVSSKAKQLQGFLRMVLMGVTLVEIACILSFNSAIVLAGTSLILLEIYLPFKLKKMID